MSLRVVRGEIQSKSSPYIKEARSVREFHSRVAQETTTRR